MRPFWKPYVPVAQRRAAAAKHTAKLAKSGHAVSPVRLEGRTIARTFWGKAWCRNLEAYSDYSNRLPRGRTYVRNGSVVDLQISKGKITSLVSGSSLYKISIEIKPLAPKHWKQIQTACAGKIDSVIELLQGRLSDAVMKIVTDTECGLFPKPAEISMDCSCPDWAGLCKHLAATLYGVGARLDEKPELLFLLRGVDPVELISRTSASQAIQQAVGDSSKPAIAESDLADVFGIELDASAPAPEGAHAPVSAAQGVKSSIPAKAKSRFRKVSIKKKSSARLVKARKSSGKKFTRSAGKKVALTSALNRAVAVKRTSRRSVRQ
jgi:uncharacterized Zn finger protein